METATLSKIELKSLEELTQALRARRITRTTFRVDVDRATAANYIYSAMKAEVGSRGGVMILDDDTRRAILDCAEWLCGDTHKAGLLLLGVSGNGKTTMMNAIVNLACYLSETKGGYGSRLDARVLNSRDLVRACAELKTADWKKLVMTPMMGLDDIGVEPAAIQQYGNMVYPFDELISRRNEQLLPTVITSNLTPQELAAKYGVRVADRLRELLHVVCFSRCSFR